MNKVEELKKIKQMLDDGILSESEYTLLKSEIINNVPANNLLISENVEIENDNQSSIDAEDLDIEEGELPVVKPHFGKKGGVLFFSIIAILVVIYQLNDKGLISFKNKTEISDDNIKDLADLETYINNEADSYCESWHKAIAYNNEQKKHEEWVRVDGFILYFQTQIIPLVVKNNDLPDDYVNKGFDFFEKRLASCGYYYYGGSPPEKQIIESNKTDELQIVEPVIIENDSNDISEPENNIEISTDNISITKGKYYEGGTIFYIDDTGKHGLLCSKNLSGQQGNNYEEAENLCNNYISGNFKDWYLPSIDELMLLYSQKKSINFLKSDVYSFYSSSTEYKLWNGGNWILDFNDGHVYGVNPLNTYSVIAVRKF
jgi:hypothetical protein